MSRSRGDQITIILIYLLNIGRNFCLYYLQIFSHEIEEETTISSIQVLQLVEMSQWPSIIFSVLIGFSIDTLFKVKTALMFFSIFEIMSQSLFFVSIYFQRFWFCCITKTFCGISEGSIFLIQMLLLGRIFLRGRIYAPLGILIGVAQATQLAGYFSLRPIFNISESLLTTTAWLITPYAFSFVASMMLVVFSNLSNDFPTTDISKVGNYHHKYVTIMMIIIFSLGPTIQFWWGFKDFLLWKYISEKDIELYARLTLHFASCVTYFFLGFLLDFFKSNHKHPVLLISLFFMFISHLGLTFTWCTPYGFIALMGVASATTDLILRASLLLIVPKSEFGSALGFIQAIANLTLATGNDFKPLIMRTVGFMFTGCVNMLCVLIASLFSVILWYLQ